MDAICMADHPLVGCLYYMGLYLCPLIRVQKNNEKTLLLRITLLMRYLLLLFSQNY